MGFCKPNAPEAADCGPSQDRLALERARDLLRSHDRILIGAGAGLSAAAGLSYAGERFERDFGPFIAKYGLTDMYSAGFFPFPTEEARWAYWAKHVQANRHKPPALPLYRDILAAVQGKDYFAITTNVDGQFAKAGFSPDRVFAVQGDYGLLQCARGCHDTLYPNRQLTERMVEQTRDCLVPSELVPRCPVCGGRMNVHLRVDGAFVENADWHAAQGRYLAFARSMADTPTLLLELGVGWNTPGIIRFPFEALAAHFDAPFIRINYDDARIDSRAKQGVGLQGDIAALWPKLTRSRKGLRAPNTARSSSSSCQSA